MTAVKKTAPEMVKIRLFKDSDKYKNDLFVSVNGENYQIRRGVDVEVPDYIAEAIQHSVEQDQISMEKREKLRDKSEE